MSGLRRMAIAGVVLAILAGCSQDPGTIFKQFKISDKTQNAVALDARQRVVIAHAPSLVSPPGLSVPRQIVCAEPSPDVAIALANSFGVGLELFGEGAGSAARGQAEGLAQLAERTITIQLLREEMYRVCEAFSNGGLTRTTYSLLLAKLNDTVVTMLLGETAGGRFGAGWRGHRDRGRGRGVGQLQFIPV